MLEAIGLRVTRCKSRSRNQRRDLLQGQIDAHVCRDGAYRRIVGDGRGLVWVRGRVTGSAGGRGRGDGDGDRCARSDATRVNTRVLECASERVGMCRSCRKM